MTSPAPQKDVTTPAQNGRDLNAAIVACFSPDTVTPAFPDRLLELASALTSQQALSLWAVIKDGEPAQMIAAGHAPRHPEKLQTLALDQLQAARDETTPKVQIAEQSLVASIALPDGGTAALLMDMPANGAVARSLAYERLTFLANLSFTQFRHSDLTGQSDLIASLNAVAGGDDTRMQSLTDSLAKITGADYAAAGLYKNQAIREVVISGQQGFAKRAQLPVELRGTMQDMARKKVIASDRMFASAPNQTDGLALIVKAPTRNLGMLRLAGAVFAQARYRKPESRWNMARLAKIGSVLMVIGVIGLIPIADGIDISATVEASNKRVITAPLSATVAEVLVQDQQAVIAGQTLLVKLDTSELDIERLGVSAERAAAILERETARANRNAAVLRNSELEVQRLDARLALLDIKRTSSEIIAPISGIALLNDLDQRSGASVRQGEALLEISDPDALRLSLSIVESQISKIARSDTGIFRPDFDPGLRLKATVSRISPAVDNREAIPLISGKATFDAPPQTLRPGLRGVFATDQVRRPIWQVLYRNIRNWVLLRVWI